MASGRVPFTFLVFNDVGQENAVLFDDICPPYCPAGWAFSPYTANSTKLMRHLRDEADARLGLLVGEQQQQQQRVRTQQQQALRALGSSLLHSALRAERLSVNCPFMREWRRVRPAATLCSLDAPRRVDRGPYS